jgi:hypothetical protein
MKLHPFRPHPSMKMDSFIDKEREILSKGAFVSTLWSTASNHHITTHHHQLLTNSGDDLLHGIPPDSTRIKTTRLDLILK